MKKKFLALVLTLAMVLSLVPVTALAAGATPTPDVVDGYYNDNDEGKWTSGKLENAIPEPLKDTVTIVNKTAEKVADQDNQYEVTLTVQMKHKTEEVQPGAAATVLVIDTSGSMDYCTDPTHTYEKDRYGNRCGTWNGRTSRLSVAKTAAINFLKSYSGFSNSDFNENGSLKNNVSGKNLRRYVSLVTFNDSASLQTWGKWNNQESWIDVSTKAGYQKLVNAINEIGAGGGTNLDAALRLAKTQSDKITQIDKNKRNVIALTDGVPTVYGNNVEKHGYYGCPDTNAATTRSADDLKANVNAVYTVCFGAENDICWTKGSVHVDHLILKDEKHTTDGPTVGDFLKDNIATQPTNGSNKKYAYNADDAEGLYQAFAAITQTITDGLNEGVVTDGLPEGVTDVEGSGFATTWTLDSSSVTPTTSNGYNVYTYTKTYKVNVDPATVSTVKVGEVNYAPLNTPTKLTVQHNGSPVEIPFPIPAGKVTYSLTGFEKALVTETDNFSNPPAGITIPKNTTSTVTVGENGVTLLYKITVKGNAGAKFTVTDTGATLVSPKDNSITFNQEGSTFSGTVGTTGEAVFYVSKQFTKRDISSDTQTVSNTATIDHGDNANGPADDEKTQTVTTPAKEPDPQNYTVTYQWADGEKPSDADTLLPQGGTFTVGSEYTVQPVPRSTATTNNAGENGEWTCEWDKSSEVGSTATAGDNIVITGTWRFTKDQPKTGNLIVKKVVSGGGVTLNDLPNIKITVAGTGTNSTYSQELTLATQDTAEPASTTVATWTISDLPTGTYTVSEENADVNGYDCTATYSATNGAAVIVNSSDASTVQNQPATDAQTVTVAADSTSTMTVTNTYTEKQEVVPTPDTSKPDVNKTATALVNDKTDVTLSVGGKSAKENVAVMFLLDKSTSQGIRDEAAEMLDELATKTNTNILYDVVIFSGTARSSGWQNIQDTTTLATIKSNFVNGSGTSGTNMSAGILKAQTDIATLKKEHTEYTETYLITLSDGITYVWSEEDQGPVYCVPVKNIGNTSEEVSIQTGPGVWNMMYHYGDSLQKIYGGVSQFLSAMPTKIAATKTDNHVKEYDSSENPIETYIYDDSKTKETTDKYACGPEVAMYYSISGYAELTKEFTKTFAYAVPEFDASTEQDNVEHWTKFPWGREVMEYCKSISFNKTWDGNVSNTNPGKIFSGIKDVIYYEIQSGSITDVIGADFSLTDQTLTKDTFTLTVNGKAVTANAPNNNVITFGEKDESTGKYPYVLTYYKGTATKNADNTYTITSGEKTYKYTPCDKTGEVNGSVSDEFFVLEMNVPVVSLDLKYNLSLTSKRTSTGTYEVPTNESATLEYTSANQSDGTVDFNEPTVSYTVKGSSGGHGGNGGGTVTIPDDVPTGLNGKDHYAYVVGYPDGMVYPQKNITRAEVATIFFRLLTDETREANMTKSNSYNDMKDGAWYTCAVSTLSKMGIIKGYEDGSFKPDASISRAEFAAIAARFDPDGDKTPATFSDVSSHWAKDEISIAANHGWIKGYEDGSFKPDQKITRAETMTLVNRVLKRLPETKDDLHKDMKTWPDNQNESAWFYLAVQEATNSHYQKLKKDGTHETWESMRETRDWAALEK